MQTHKPKPYEIIEAVFDTCYLLFALGIGVYLLANANGDPAIRLYGALALVLGGGDSFHLVPRIYGCLTGRMAELTRPLGFGKLVTSVTMTVFYVLLFHVWQQVYAMHIFTPIVYALAIVRIVLSLLPQNRWFDQNPPLFWAVVRNLPFAAMGVLAIALYAFAGMAVGDPFRFMPIAIALSFGFYIPVVLFSQKKPAVGALMLPKTAAYVWILCMGLGLL